MLLEEYNEKLDASTDIEVKKSLEKLINVFRSRFFGALLGKSFFPYVILK